MDILKGLYQATKLVYPKWLFNAGLHVMNVPGGKF